MKVRTLRTLMLATTAVFMAAPAASQEFPSKALRIISPFAPGGATDTLGREPLVGHGLAPAPTTPEQFTAFVRSEMERNGKIVKALNLKIE